MSTNAGHRPFSLPGGRVFPDQVVRPRTGSWRAGTRPEVTLDRCVNCLLCWVYCPDRAIQTRNAVFIGIDYDVCKGCEICVEVCPTSAILMVTEGADFLAAPGGDPNGNG